MDPLLISAVLCVLCHFSRANSATPWTVAHQAPLHGILQARELKWIAITPSFRCIQLISLSCLSHQLGWLQRMKWLSPLLLHRKMSMEFCESWGRIWNTSEAMLWKTPSVPSAIFYRSKKFTKTDSGGWGKTLLMGWSC